MVENVKPEDEWVQERDLVKAHYSSLTLHRKCPQAWSYRYEYGLRRPIVGPAPELHFGSWWGAIVGADALERGRKWDSMVVKPRKFTPVDGGPTFDQADLTVLDVLMAAKEWWQKQDEVTVEEWMKRIGAPLPRRLRDAYVRWRDEWASERKNERPLGLEIFWQRALPRPSDDANWETDGDPARFEGLPEIKLIGFIDQAYFDAARGMVVLRDDKSAKTLAQQTSLDDMMDSQLQLYSWGAQPLFDNLGITEKYGKIRAVAYDRIKSSAPATPKLNLNGSLSASTTLYDLKTYQDWAKGPDGQGVPWGKEGEYFTTGKNKGAPKFGRYTEDPKLVEKLSMPVWRSIFHQRTITPISRNIIRAHLRAAVDTATDIWRTQKRFQVVGEAARNLSKSNCTYCDYQTLCRAQMVGGPEGEYDLREFNLVSRDGRPELNTMLMGAV